MADFKLNEEDNATLRNRPKAKKGGFANMLIGWGIAKTKAQANLYLIVLVVVCISVLAKSLTTIANFASLGLINKLLGGFFGRLFARSPKFSVILHRQLHFFNEQLALLLVYRIVQFATTIESWEDSQSS